MFTCATWAQDPRQGDSLWLIHGANVPVLLRQDGPSTWKMVGPANYDPEHSLWKRCLHRYQKWQDGFRDTRNRVITYLAPDQ